MAKSFEEVLIDQINSCDRAIKQYSYLLKDPEIGDGSRRHCELMIKSYERDEAFFTFASRINDIMQLDIDDVVFRRTIGAFFTELVKEVMGEQEENE